MDLNNISMNLYKVVYILIFWNLLKFISDKILLNKKLHNIYIILHYTKIYLK